MTYHHTGIPVFEKMEGMMYVEPLKVWVTDAGVSPYKVEWLYFEPDSPMAAAIQGDWPPDWLEQPSLRGSRYAARAVGIAGNAGHGSGDAQAVSGSSWQAESC